jgi:hypothetical protein
VTPPIFTDLQARLIANYPGLFVEKWQAHKPLKGGIREDLLAAHPDIDVELLSRFLAFYVLRRQYCLAVLEPDARRHDLAGKPVEPIDDRARAHARAQLAHLDASGLEAIEAVEEYRSLKQLYETLKPLLPLRRLCSDQISDGVIARLEDEFNEQLGAELLWQLGDHVESQLEDDGYSHGADDEDNEQQ